MPQPVGQLVSLLLRRVRDPEAVATPRQFVRDRIAEAQTIVNLAVPGTIAQATMPTYRSRVLYDWPHVGLTRDGQPVASDEVAQIAAVRDDEGRDLVWVNWRSFARVDRGWIRTTKRQHQFVARMGTDIIALYPARDVDSQVTLLYVKQLAPLLSDDDQTEVRDDRLPAILALAEAVILCHRRLYAAMETAMIRMETELKRLPSHQGAGQATFFPEGSL